MVACQLKIFYNPENLPQDIFLILLIVALGAYFWGTRSRVPVENPDLAPIESIRSEPIRLKLAWVVIACGLSAFAAWRATLQPPQAYLGEHLSVWALSMGALIVAVWPDKHIHSDNLALHKTEYVLLLAFFLGTLGLHILNLNSVPYLLDQDEAGFAMDGVAIKQAHFLISPFEPGFQSHPTLYQAMIGLSVALFGQTLPAARLPSAVLGALGIPAVYLLGRELAGKFIGLVAALYILTWPFHMLFSRIALNQPADPVFTTLAFYFLLRGLRGKPINFILCGICLGIAQYFYLGGLVAILVMVAYLGFMWLRKRSLLTSQWRGILLVPLAAVIVTFPRNYYLLHFHLPFTTRAWNNFILTGDFTSLTWQGLADQFNKSFFALFTTPDQYWYGSSSNLLGPFAGPFLLIGVGISIIALRKYPRWSLPLGWAVAVILGGSTFGVNTPSYQRYFPGVSAFALLVAMGISSVAGEITTIIRRPGDREQLLATVGIALFTLDLLFYNFIYVPERRYFANRPNQVTNQLARTMQSSYDAGQQIVLITSPRPGLDRQLTDPIIATAIFYSQGVDDSYVVQYFMADRKYTVINGYKDFNFEELSPVDFSKPFAIIIPIIYEDQFTELSNKHGPDTLKALISIPEDGSPAFYLYQSATGINNP